MVSQRFTKARRVRHRGEFTRVFELALRAQGRYLTVLMAPNKTGASRLGIVASRKLGDAVHRNLAKRLIREMFRLSSAPPAGVDLVVIPRRELFEAPYSSLQSDFRGVVKRCAARLPANDPR